MKQYFKSEGNSIEYSCELFNLDIIYITYNENGENHTYSQNRLHKHPHYEICCVTNGYCEFEIYNKTRFVVNKNCFILFPPTCEHRIVFESPGFAKLSALFSFQPIANNENTFYQAVQIAANDIKVYKSNKNIRFYIKRFLDIFCGKSMDYEHLLLANFISFIIETYQVITYKKKIEIKHLYNDKRINDAIKFIDGNASNELTVASVSKHLHISPKQLTRLFEQFLSTTPGRYIKTACVNKIRELIINTDNSLSDIADIMKYSDASALIKFFKGQEGITPSKLRDKIIKSGN